MDPLTYFTAEQIDLAQSYHLEKLIYFFLSTSLTIIFLLALHVKQFNKILHIRIKEKFGENRRINIVIYVIVVVGLYFIFISPVSYISGFVLEHAYELTDRSFGNWIGDKAKSALLAIIAISIITIVIFELAKLWKSRWWIGAWATTSILLIMTMFIYPVAILPLFNTYQPLEKGSLKDGIISLVKKAKVDPGEILLADKSRQTKRLNAFVVGLGPTKEIVLYDNLITGADQKEIEIIVAHELAHNIKYHIWKGLGLWIVGTIFFWWILSRILNWASKKGRFNIETIYDPKAIPLILLTIFIFLEISAPIQNAISRKFERQADKIALNLTQDSETFIKMKKKMAIKNLSEITPSPAKVFWFYTHSPVLERIQMAKELPLKTRDKGK